MRGCLLKCSSEQVRKATDAEWLGAELSKTLATELLKSRQRSGQRGYVDVEAEGQPSEEPPADTRPDVNQILEAVVPAPSVLAPIPEESYSMDTTMPEVAEPGSESVDRNVRPPLAPDQEVTQLDEVEDSQSTTQTRRDHDQTPDEFPVENLSGAASSIPTSLPLVSASNYLTDLPVETEFDSKAQAVVHGSVDAVTERDSTTFEAVEGMAVFDSETQSFWVAPRPKDKSGVVCDELSDTDKKKIDASRFKEIDNLLKLNALSVMSPEESDHFAKTTPENIIPTNMLDKWKLQGDGSVAAKSRSVLVGWKDPMIYQLERAAPAGRDHGDTSVAGISEGDRPHSRSDQCIRTGSPDIKKKQTCHKTATGSDSSKGGTRTVVAC